MKLPHKVKVLGVPFTIEYAESIDESDFGCVNYAKNRIVIYNKNNRAVEDIWRSIWHEIVHVLFYRLDIDYPTERKGEQAVQRLSTGLNSVLLDNGIIEIEKPISEQEDKELLPNTWEMEAWNALEKKGKDSKRSTRK